MVTISPWLNKQYDLFFYTGKLEFRKVKELAEQVEI